MKLLEHIIPPDPPPGEVHPHYTLDFAPGRTGPARVVELAAGRALVHDFGTGLDAINWLMAEHEAALLLDAEVVELTPAAAGEVME